MKKPGSGRKLGINRKSDELRKPGSYNVGPYKVFIARIVPGDAAIVDYIFEDNMDPK